MKISLLNWATTLAVVGAMALPVMAGGGGGGGGGGGRGGRGGAAGGAGGGMGGGGMGGGGGAMGGGGGAMGGGGGAMGGGGGARGATQTPDQRADALQTTLNVTDANEWTVLRPKIVKVLQDQAVLAVANARGAGGGRGGRGAATAPAADASNPLATSWADLVTAVSATPPAAEADLKTKLAKVRDDRTKAQKTLTDDQDALKKVCSIRQEAILVTQGLLN